MPSDAEGGTGPFMSIPRTTPPTVTTPGDTGKPIGRRATSRSRESACALGSLGATGARLISAIATGSDASRATKRDQVITGHERREAIDAAIVGLHRGPLRQARPSRDVAALEDPDLYAHQRFPGFVDDGAGDRTVPPHRYDDVARAFSEVQDE